MSEDEKSQLLAVVEAIALSQKPLDEILHPNGVPETSEEAEESDELEDEQEDEKTDDDDDEFAEIDQALSALEQDLGGDPTRLAEIASDSAHEEQPSSEESDGEFNSKAPTE